MMLNLLVELQGQTIAWSGFDKESDAYVILFENGTALSVPSFEIIEDFRVFAAAMVSSEITEARQLVALEALLTQEKETKEAADEKPAGN